MISKYASVHKGANVHPDARIADFARIGDQVEIGAGSVVESHAVVNGPTIIGINNRISSFASVGGDPQDITYKQSQKSRLVIGDGNLIREFCTINRGTEKEPQALTKIGSNNMLMAYVHIAHDCQLGDYIIMANNSSLAGHVHIEDYAFLGGFTLVKQFCTIGQSVYTGMGCHINKDIPPYLVVSGMPTKVRSVNVTGLKRRKFSGRTVSAIKNAFKVVYRDNEGQVIDNTLTKLKKLEKNCSEVINFINFIRTSKTGIMRGDALD